MFAYREVVGQVEVAFTDRLSPSADAGPFDVFTLAVPQAVEHGTAEHDRALEGVRANLDLLSGAFADLGGPPTVQVMRQVHGRDVAVIDAPVEPPTADALVTGVPGVLLVARAADCVPVLIGDPDRGLVAAVHAGRAGVIADVVGAAVAVLREQGAVDLRAWVGPHACGRCYEVPEEMRAEVAATEPSTSSTTTWGTPALDLGAGVVAQLARAGVTEVVDLDRCTLEDPDLFSHRREGAAGGRHAGVIRRRG